MANENEIRQGGQQGQGQQGQEDQQGKNQDERQNQQDQRQKGSSNRGFAAMDPAKAREIQSKGGKAVSQDRQHMAQIGRVGGEHSHGSDNRQ